MLMGKYLFGFEDGGSWLNSDGKVGFIDSGSVVGMDHLVRTMVWDFSVTVPKAVRMVSLPPGLRATANPGTRTGISLSLACMRGGGYSVCRNSVAVCS
ncbi:MAG: hypothetical protein M2R45_05092 [Verrucomicrobia subdivision 3 bacterium]|nr:hypothetical protein [Limisphaerales bacterium]MCS1417169.1 hypothetical protein [Limisphaerales bacterium]